MSIELYNWVISIHSSTVANFSTVSSSQTYYDVIASYTTSSLGFILWVFMTNKRWWCRLVLSYIVQRIPFQGKFIGLRFFAWNRSRVSIFFYCNFMICFISSRGLSVYWFVTSSFFLSFFFTCIFRRSLEMGHGKYAAAVPWLYTGIEGMIRATTTCRYKC